MYVIDRVSIDRDNEKKIFFAFNSMNLSKKKLDLISVNIRLNYNELISLLI